MSGPSDDARYRALFQEESQELLDGFLSCLFALEQSPGDLAPVDELFRVAHTLKGMAGAMGFAGIAEFCHQAENLLDRWRADKAPIGRQDLEFMFQVESALRDMTVNPDDPASHQPFAALFAHAPVPGEGSEEALPVTAASFAPPAEGEVALLVTLEGEVAYPRLRFKMVLNRLEKHARSVRTAPPAEEWEALGSGATVAYYLVTEEPVPALLEVAASVGEVAMVVEMQSEEAARSGTTAPVPSRAAGAGPLPAAGAGPLPAAGAGPLPAAGAGPLPAGGLPSFQQTGIRVERKKLDAITNRVGEILLLRRRLETVLAAYDDPALADILEQIERTSRDLEYEVLSARMVPVGSIFQRFQRLVRELAAQLGKEVDAQFVGGETEIDRALLDRVSEPLVHIIRNSLDHGLETPAEREAAGKARRGILVVTAAMEHGNVAIKVEDDGRGIDAALVLAAARRKGLLRPDSTEELTRAQIFSLLFQPGFSTAEKITDISGRGVGLDVVRKKVVEVGGDINMISEKGQGTKVILEFPPTLSLLRCLIVQAGKLVVGVPQNQVYHIVRIAPTDLSWVRDTPMVIVDEQPVSLRSLAGLLGRGSPHDVESSTWMLLVRLSSRIEALAIDGLVGDQELVVKPLMKSLSHGPGLVGTGLLADGRLALFVDLRLLLLQKNEPAATRVG